MDAKHHEKKFPLSEPRSCVRVEVVVLGSGFLVANSPYCLCRRKATFEEEQELSLSEIRNCVKEEVDDLDSHP